MPISFLWSWEAFRTAYCHLGGETSFTLCQLISWDFRPDQPIIFLFAALVYPFFHFFYLFRKSNGRHLMMTLACILFFVLSLLGNRFTSLMYGEESEFTFNEQKSKLNTITVSNIADHSPYKEIQLHYKSYWHWEFDGRRLKAVVSADLNEKGSLENVNIIDSSGDHDFDAGVLLTLNTADPLPTELVNRIPNDKKSFRFVFDSEP